MTLPCPTCGARHGPARRCPHMTEPTLRRGMLFEHARLLDTSWQPGPGERYADAPPAVCYVTAVRSGRIAAHVRRILP